LIAGAIKEGSWAVAYVEVDRGDDVEPKSLERVADDPNAFPWVRGGMRKSARYGGP
jgi:hypothetical protein